MKRSKDRQKGSLCASYKFLLAYAIVVIVFTILGVVLNFMPPKRAVYYAVTGKYAGDIECLLIIISLAFGSLFCSSFAIYGFASKKACAVAVAIGVISITLISK